MQEKTLILIVEDNPIEATMVADSLLENGYEVLKAENGEKGMDEFTNHPVDLVILDVMLPTENGYEIAKKIREIDDDIPIIFLTSKKMKNDQVEGFNAGGDDYVAKPFDNELLLLRIKALLKRTSKHKEDECIYKIGQFNFDCKNLELRSKEEKRRMTKRESDVLQMLCENVNEIVKREDLLTKIWGENDYFNGRSLDVFITKLRKYLKEDERIKIENIHGVGFLLNINME
jgi:DNA-binding response OmpR family regulator